MMIQDIYPYKLYNQYNPQAEPDEDSFILIIRGAEVLAGENLTFPHMADIRDCRKDGLIYLFSVDSETYYLYPEKDFVLEERLLKPEAYQFYNLRQLRESFQPPKHRLFAVYTAKHLADWYRDTQFCGRCGTKTEHSKTERARVCPSCGYTAYPRIMPAVIVGVCNKDRILITKYRNGYNHSALIAGFTEIGETLEETVAREVMEEAGIHVKNIRYYKSQPWGIANDILVGYYCDVDGDDTIHMDNQELKYAEWLRGDEIVFQPDNSSLTNEMMHYFAEITAGGKCSDEQDQ